MRALQLLFDLVEWRAGPLRLSHQQASHLAQRRGVTLPAVAWDAEFSQEQDLAADRVVGALVDGLARCFAPDGAASREELNSLLDAWGVRLSLEDEVGSRELPGVDLEATTIPPAPLTPLEMMRGGVDAVGVPLAATPLAPCLLALASKLLTGVTNVHLSGYDDRVRWCGSRDCGRPFLDTTPGGTGRRWCSSRCRAREGARRLAR